jgi:RNase P subunit RPR2
MKFSGLERRLREIEPESVDLEEQRELEESKLLLQAFEPHFMTRLAEQGLSALVPEMKEALRTVGPRPFGHSRAGDRAVWNCIDEVSDRHHEFVYRIRAADSLALADALIELGAPEDDRHVVIFRKMAARDIEWEKKEKQTFCDKCGSNLDSWSCYSGTRNGQTVKLCRKCAS